MYRSYPVISIALAVVITATALHAGTITFDDLPLTSTNEAIAESFVSGDATFPGATVFDCCWSGWVYSNSTLNQDLNVSPGTIPESDPLQRPQWSTAYVPLEGADLPYAVASLADSQVEPETGRTPSGVPVAFPSGQTIVSLEVANTTWTAHSMLVGDAFSGPFSEDDFFRLTITGLLGEEVIGDVEVSLAEGMDVLDRWQFVSLAELRGANVLEFSLASSDTSTFGETLFLNTPAFFAVDNIVTESIPEPASSLLALVAMAFLCRRRRRIISNGQPWDSSFDRAW